MKKLISAILCIVMISAMCSVSLSASAAVADVKKTSAISRIAELKSKPELAQSRANSELAKTGGYEYYDYDGFEFGLYDDDTAVLLGYYGDETDVVIPSVVNEHTVDTISAQAFYECSQIKKVTIPDTVEYIGEEAFYCCEALTSVVMGKNVAVVGERAFYGCTSLSNITLSPNIFYVGDSAFDDTKWLSTRPNGVLYIGTALYRYVGDMPQNTAVAVKSGTTMICDAAFMYRENLTKITLPDSLLFIGKDVFYMASISKVVIPDSVYSIGEYAFFWCENLLDITVPDGVIIGAHAFDATAWYYGQPDGMIYINNVLYSYKGDMTPNAKLTVKNGTTGICGYCFSDLEMIPFSITLPDSLEWIDDGAFAYSGITAVDFPDSICSIGEYAFQGCENLKDVILSENLAYIGEGAFEDCTSLKSIELPENLYEVGESAFVNTGLKSVTIPAYTSLSANSFGYDLIWVADEYDEDTYYGKYNPVDNFTIYGYTNSDAEYYAERNGFDFVSIGIINDGFFYILGDVDGDGEVSILDATTIQMQLAKLPVDLYIEAAADTDEDGDISILDATYIQMYLAKLVTDTNIGEEYEMWD